LLLQEGLSWEGMAGIHGTHGNSVGDTLVTFHVWNKKHCHCVPVPGVTVITKQPFLPHRRSYRKNEVIEENKALLKEKYTTAKALGKQVCSDTASKAFCIQLPPKYHSCI